MEDGGQSSGDGEEDALKGGGGRSAEKGDTSENERVEPYNKIAEAMGHH